MVYKGLRIELPRLRRSIQPIKKTTRPKIVTISLLNPPRSYRANQEATSKVITYYF